MGLDQLRLRVRELLSKPGRPLFFFQEQVIRRRLVCHRGTQLNRVLFPLLFQFLLPHVVHLLKLPVAISSDFRKIFLTVALARVHVHLPDGRQHNRAASDPRHRRARMLLLLLLLLSLCSGRRSLLTSSFPPLLPPLVAPRHWVVRHLIFRVPKTGA